MLAILIICLVIFGAISLPIGIAMGLATMLCLVFATNIDPIMVAQNAFAGIDSFSLMAIPFFMLAGNFMRYGGISKRLLDLADNIVGFFTGGLGAITTFTAMFYAAISGSGPATVSAIGSFMIPEMEEKGYDKGYATALSGSRYHRRHHSPVHPLRHLRRSHRHLHRRYVQGRCYPRSADGPGADALQLGHQ